MLNMKLQSESVPEKRQSWSVWRADGKETVLLEDIATSSKDTPEHINNELHVGDFLTEINSDKEERNSPEPSECFPTNGIFDLTDHHLSPERTEEVNMAAQTKGEEFKHLIANRGLSPKETHTRAALKSNQITPVEMNEHNSRYTNILDDPEPRPLSRLNKFREVLRIVLNVGLLLGEGGAWITLYGEMDVTNQEYILLFLILPTVLTSSGWLAANWCNKTISWAYFSTVFCLTLASVPSPIFLHLFYLYEVTKCVGRSRPLGNLIALCQLCHAFTGSLPLVMSGGYMLLQAVVRDDKSIAINHIAQFLEKHPMYAPAMFLSFCLVVTSVHRYNERRTSTLISILVTIPFTIITIAIRIVAVSVILAFHPSKWSILLLAVLSFALLLLNLACQANLAKYPKSTPEDEGMAECCASSNCTFLLFKLPRMLLKAVGDIFIPLGYDGDGELCQGLVRGSWQIVLNYAITMACLGVGLATAILHHVPNTYHGLEMTKMGMMVEIPETNVILRTGSGMDIQVKMPATNVDLANTANLEASIAMDDTMDLIVAIAVPMLLVLVSLPVTITRVAMIGLNCVVVREEVMSTESGQQSLRQEVQRARKGVSGRLGLSICCGVSGAVVTSLFMLIGTSLLAVKLFS